MTSIESLPIDVQALLSLYASNSAAKAALDHFAGRHNMSSKTSVERLQALLRGEGHDVARSDIIQFFRALETARCGQFVIGRKGHPSRFEWTASLISVGQAASGETNSVEPLTEAESAQLGVDDATADLLDHRFRLRVDLEITITLPADMTATEAARIADFVRTLPFVN